MNLRVFSIFALVAVSTGYRQFQDRIPNGDHIPHPCKPNFVWRGVGHLNPLGGGARNPFGLDFDKYGRAWTKELCQADSDGDGLTNGQELGDPECKWQSGHFPERVTGITHPGVCHPWDSDQCQEKNADISCETGEFECPAILEPHVRNITLRFPRTRVPAEETSYMCMSFDLEFPDDDPPGQEYHLIATEPIIDNPNVMHHITINGCLNTAKKLTEPELCYMAQDGCFFALGLWTLGMPGECIYEEAGFKIGGPGTRTVMLQFHWTNPERITDYYDESGMVIYYTTQLRKYNAGFYNTGQINLEIPPGQSRVVQTGTCSSECTRHNINKGVYITTGLNHMHYLGRRGKLQACSQDLVPMPCEGIWSGCRGIQQNVEQYRNDKKIKDLTKEDIYSYDNPIVFQYDPPQLLLPGDRLETTCVYRSLSRTRTTYFGEGTYDEMCFGIFTVFPIENVTFPACINWGNVDQCGIGNGVTDNCNITKFFDKSLPATAALRRLVLDNCNFYGSCRQECPAALAKAREDPCLQGDIGEFVLWSLTMTKNLEDTKFLGALSSCDCPVDKLGGTRALSQDENNSGHMNLPTVYIFLLALLSALITRNS